MRRHWPISAARIHSDDGPEHPDQHIASWTRDLLTKPHPTFHPEDFTIVAEAAAGRIVSALNLIPQTWTYEGIPFGVGRPELVGTLPEYRNRGLVRLQFEEIHRWSAARGDFAQAITGIPFYYRLFGYEMALDLSGRRFGYEANVPFLEAGKEEPCHIRPAHPDDLPFVAEVYAGAQKRYEIACLRGVDILEYELNLQEKQSNAHFELRIIEDRQGKRLGYFQHPAYLGMTGLTAVGFELKQGNSWLDPSECIVRYLWDQGQIYAKQEGQQCRSFGFMLGERHPVYEALGPRLPSFREPYAWYLRSRRSAGLHPPYRPGVGKTTERVDCRRVWRPSRPEFLPPGIAPGFRGRALEAGGGMAARV